MVIQEENHVKALQIRGIMCMFGPDRPSLFSAA